MNKVLSFFQSDKPIPTPETLDDAWRLAELYGEVDVDHPGFGEKRYRVRIKGYTPAGSWMWAEGKGDEIIVAVIRALDEAHNHGIRPK